MKSIAWFNELGRADLRTAGGKGSNLGELCRAGAPVPPGFVITTAAYNQFVADNQLQSLLLRLAAHGREREPGSDQVAAAAIRQAFAGCTMAADLAEQIGDAYADLVMAGSPAVAVRSSATAEDLPGASFAGQQDTFLNISELADLLDAAVDCWASLWTARAIAYRRRQGIDHADVSIAVVVQQMVPAEAAGILCTADPVSGRRDRAVISAAWGLGDAVVGGRVTPDTIIVDRETGAIVSRDTADKELMTVRTLHGTADVTVPETLRHRPVLDDDAVADLVTLGNHIARHFGAPQDIEWVWNSDGFAIVQARPITALPEDIAPPPADWTLPTPDDRLMRTSIVDLMPDPLTPLFATMGIRRINESINALLKEVGGSPLDLPHDMFRTVNGFAYADLSYTWRDYWRLLRIMLPLVPDMLRGMSTTWKEDALPRYRATVTSWERPPAGMSNGELLDGIDALLRAAIRYVNVLQMGPMGAGGSEALFTRFYKRLVQQEGDPEAADMLKGFRSVPIEASCALYDLARWIDRQPALAAFFHRTGSETLVHRWRAPDPPAGVDRQVWEAWQNRFSVYLDRYGYALYSLDFGQPLPADDPQPMLEALRMHLRREGPNPHERQHALAHARELGVAHVRARLGPLRRRLFNLTLRWAQTMAPVREDAIAEIGLGYPRMRHLLLELGWRLTEAGLLQAADDIFFLEENELACAAEALEAGLPTRPLDVRAARRRAVWRGARQIAPPPTLPPDNKYMGINVETFLPVAAEDQESQQLRGVAASPGVVTARARVLHGPDDFGRMQPGDILVATVTTPAWTPLFAMAAGIVTDIGGPLSHGSIVAREYAIPAVLGTGVATRRISDGRLITVDGNRGVVIPADDLDQLDRPVLAHPAPEPEPDVMPAEPEQPLAVH